MGNSNGWAESRRYSLDLKPDSDNANVGKYMSEMIGFCVRAPCFLCELGAPLFTRKITGAVSYRYGYMIRCLFVLQGICPVVQKMCNYER